MADPGRQGGRLAVNRDGPVADRSGSGRPFVPVVIDPGDVETLVDGVDGPPDVLGGPGASTISVPDEVGVARASSR